jgi:hypothetical protein
MLAFELVMPMVDHRICVRHLYANFRDIGGASRVGTEGIVVGCSAFIHRI